MTGEKWGMGGGDANKEYLEGSGGAELFRGNDMCL